MARSVTFGGSTQFRPGALSRITVSQQVPTNTATGIVSIIGEADGGQPGTVLTIDDPALAQSFFRSGPLADAIRLAFDPTDDVRLGGGAFRVYAYKTNAGTQATTQTQGQTANPILSDSALVGSTTTVINFTATLIATAQVGRWLQIGTEKRRIVSNTTSTVTVSPGFSTAPVTATTLLILANPFLITSRDYGAHTNAIAFELEPGVTSNTVIVTVSSGTTVEQSPELAGNAFLEVKYVGGPVPIEGAGVNPASNLPITAATTTTVTCTVLTAPTSNQYANMVLQFSDGKQRLITANTAASPTIFTLDGTTPLTTAEATAAVGQTATVRNVVSAVGSFVGSGGVATTFTTAVLTTADNLSIALTAGMTLTQFVGVLNTTTNFQATIPAGVNGDVILMSSFDFGTRATSVDLRYDRTISYATKGTFRRDLQVVIDWINSFSSLITATRGTGAAQSGAELPQTTGGTTATVRDSFIGLSGGTRGVTVNSNFQAGFDAITNVRTNYCVPLISQDMVNEGNGSTATFASVAAQASSFATNCAHSAKNECGVVLGMSGTKTQLIAQAANLNNTDVQLTGQKITVLNVGGTLVLQPEWAMAVVAVGMRAGAQEVGTPLTFKTFRCNGLTQDSSWSPRSITDQNALIQAGVLYAEQTPQGTFRMVRDITTWLNDDNICFVDGNMRDEIRFIAYDLRKGIEDAFTGLKAIPSTVSNIRDFTANRLASYVSQNILVNSLDPETLTQTIPGWRRLRVFASGNVVTIRVEVFPAAQVLFELLDISVSIPSLAA